MAADIRYGILGPLEVRVGEQQVEVGGPRVQAVLAALILAKGSEVSAEQLIDTVWGDDPPPTVRTSLQVHISKIRANLAEAGLRDVLVTHGSSYMYLAEPGQVDAWEFHGLMDEGGRALSAGLFEEALENFRSALSLWRGAPLAGLDLQGLPPGSLREFEELRDLAIVHCVEAELSLGRHAEALPHVLRLRAGAPLDERVCELAALTLYRNGRQADALAELASLRREMAEQLGMQPGRAIAELEGRILSGDPELMPSLGETAEPREVRKTVTVLALRLPQGDPEDVLAATRAVSDLFEGAVSNLDGWCPPARAGRLLGIFGLPAAHEDDAERAVRTGDAIKRAALAVGLEVRIGLSTGEVLVQVGGDIRLLTHDPVEVADLLARKARPGEVLLGVATQRLVGAMAEVDSSQLLVIDDEEAPLVAHQLLHVADTPPAPRLSAPLVGRENDLIRLRDAAQRAIRDRRPTMLAVLGPAGIGKSRLINAFTATLGDRVDVVTARCLPYGRDVGLSPIAEIIRRVLGVSEARQASVISRLEEFLAGQPDRDMLVSLLAQLVGVVDGVSKRDETFWAIRRCLEIAARRQPLAVVLEDLQWAEAPILDLIPYVASSTSKGALLLVCSARPEFDERRPSWGGVGSDAVTIRLEPLTPPESDQLLTLLLGSGGLEPSVRERITAAAEGNPLFIEEVLSVLIDDGQLRQRAGRWESAADLGVVPIPPTVKALLDARVDLLPPRERDVLEAAAIVGREFDLDDLNGVRPDADMDGTLDALDALCRRGLLDLRRFTNRGSSSYAFRNLLIRDVAYAAVPRDRRARDHELLGKELNERARDRLPEVEEAVGHHFEAAFHLGSKSGPTEAHEALGELAAEHLAAAGRRAFALDDATAAASLFERAMSCVPTNYGLQAELARLRGSALFDLGRFEEARGVLVEGLAAVRALGDKALEWRLELELIELDVYTRPGERPIAETRLFAERAIAALTELADVAGVARSYRLLGESLTLQGRLDEGIEAFAHGARLAHEAGDEREIALPQQLMALHGTTPLAVFIVQCEQLMANRAHRPRPEVVMRLAYAHALAGDEGSARSCLGDGLALARDVGGAFRIADAELYAGLTLLALGEPAEAAGLLESSTRRLTQIGEGNLRSTVEGFLADAWFRVGSLAEAAAASERSRAIAADDDWASQILWRQVTAKVVALQGAMNEAVALILEACAIADRTDFLTLAASAHLDAAALLWQSGDQDSAERELSLARQLSSRKGLCWEIADAASLATRLDSGRAAPQ